MSEPPPRDWFPDDLGEWNDVPVDLEPLIPDDPSACLFSQEEILDYIGLESADGAADADRLTFLRTALVGRRRCWLWRYVERDDTEYYVLAGGVSLSMRPAHGLSPDHFIVADYYDAF